MAGVGPRAPPRPLQGFGLRIQSAVPGWVLSIRPLFGSRSAAHMEGARHPDTIRPWPDAGGSRIMSRQPDTPRSLRDEAPTFTEALPVAVR